MIVAPRYRGIEPVSAAQFAAVRRALEQRDPIKREAMLFAFQQGGLGRINKPVVAGGGGDPDRASRLLVLHCNGADNGTTFTDSGPSARTMTVTGTLVTSTSSPKFGSAAALVQASGDQVRCADSSDFAVGTGAITYAAWVKPTYSGTYGSFISHGEFNGSSGSQIFIGTTGVAFRTEGTSDLTASATLNDGNWHYVKCVLTAGPGTRYKKIFIDGTEVNSTTTSANLSTPDGVDIGSVSDSSGSFRFAGRFDEVVISALADLSTGVPTTELPDF